VDEYEGIFFVYTPQSISGSAYIHLHFFVKNKLVSLKSIHSEPTLCIEYTVYSAYLTVFLSKKNNSALRTCCEVGGLALLS
jgi:hypothetical protein